MYLLVTYWFYSNQNQLFLILTEGSPPPLTPHNNMKVILFFRVLSAKDNHVCTLEIKMRNNQHMVLITVFLHPVCPDIYFVINPGS